MTYGLLTGINEEQVLFTYLSPDVGYDQSGCLMTWDYVNMKLIVSQDPLTAESDGEES